MEKRTPHCRLAAVKALAEAGKVRTTHSARAGAAALGFDFPGMMAVILALSPATFYKSMTTHADHKSLAGRLPSQHIRWRRVPEIDRG